MTMTHPGLPLFWVVIIVTAMLAIIIWALMTKAPVSYEKKELSLTKVPFIGGVFRYLSVQTLPLLILKVLVAFVFIVIVTAGLWGTPIVERNIATSITWNLWWAGIVVAILFSGSAWCAICPWDNIATCLVEHRLWRRSNSHTRLHLKVPVILRSVWPASLLFIGFTWLELGVGIVSSPYATAVLAVLMVVLATTCLALYEGKAFCRYMCPVGRTVGAYSQLSPVALRPIDLDVCRSCTSLECYHGSDLIAPCPTKLVMGRLQENTYCTACGNCSQSCPSKNIAWQLRSPSYEVMVSARPHTDEACFMLILFSLTVFHGFTMLDSWPDMMSAMARSFGDSGKLLISFSVGLVACIMVPSLIYGFFVLLSKKISVDATRTNYSHFFSGFSFSVLPLAFSYHMAHNFGHFFRERNNWSELITNPLGVGAQPLSMAEKHARHMDMMIPESVLFSLQGVFMLAGFFIAVQVVRYRGGRLFSMAGKKLLPMLTFVLLVTLFNVWMLVQPMTMRM
ncbi:MAG: hypothetical protein COA42_11805 [Alteromonadaceae bacterium]|nr:MAG: hypothetical protein COA42_11805 [Alteromonadaceae bacterium]